MRKAPFVRYVREEMMSQGDRDNYRFNKTALDMLQTGLEEFITEILANADLIAQNAGRVTVLVKDVKLANQIKHGELPQPK